MKHWLRKLLAWLLALIVTSTIDYLLSDTKDILESVIRGAVYTLIVIVITSIEQKQIGNKRDKE